MLVVILRRSPPKQVLASRQGKSRCLAALLGWVRVWSGYAQSGAEDRAEDLSAAVETPDVNDALLEVWESLGSR